MDENNSDSIIERLGARAERVSSSTGVPQSPRLEQLARELQDAGAGRPEETETIVVAGNRRDSQLGKTRNALVSEYKKLLARD